MFVGFLGRTVIKVQLNLSKQKARLMQTYYYKSLNFLFANKLIHYYKIYFTAMLLYLGLLKISSVRVFINRGRYLWPGVDEDSAVLQHQLALHPRRDLPRSRHLACFTSHPFLWKRQQLKS